jgi:hypothetical protein
MTHPDADALPAAQLERFAKKKTEGLPRKVQEGELPKYRTPVQRAVSAGPPPAIMPASRGAAKQRERIRRNRKSPTAAMTKAASLVKARTRKKQR